MKRILLALLSILIVIFPSCENDIKQTEPTGNVERTEIRLYIDGVLSEPDRNRNDILVFMKELSVSNPSDTVTVTVKNTGKHPAHIYFNHQELDSCIIQSSLPEVLNPGQSADVKFTYNIPADKGLAPGSRVGNMNFNGNFDSKAIAFAGSKVDVPLLKLNINTNIGYVYPYGISLGTEEMMEQKFNVLNFKSTGNDEVVLQYQFYQPTENHYSIESIEVLGKDAEYFTSIRSNERSLGLRFKPVETRKHTVTVRFHINSSDFKEYIRDMPLMIDVVSIDRSFFLNNEYHLNGYPNSSLFTMASRSNGHAYIYAVQGDREGFIEIDENDGYVDWYGTQNIIHSRAPIASWVDEEHDAVFILRTDMNGSERSGEYYYELLDLISDDRPNSIQQGVIFKFEGSHSQYEYLGQSDEYLMFQNDIALKFVDKQTFDLITVVENENVGEDGVYFPMKPFKQVLYDNEAESYILVNAGGIRIAEYDDIAGLKIKKQFVLDQINGFIENIAIIPNGFLVLTDGNELYEVKIAASDFSVEKIGELKGYNPDELYYSKNHLYFTEERTNKIYAYDFDSKKIIPISELPKPYDYGYRYHLLERNGNLYCTTTIRDYPYDQSGKQGYVRRIPLI